MVIPFSVAQDNIMEITYNIEQLPEVAENLKGLLPRHFYFGEMGAGKTALIKELAKQLGSKDRVSSPTFSLVNEYHAENDYIYHFDFHRVEDETEAYDIGFSIYRGHWVFIEWRIG